MGMEHDLNGQREFSIPEISAVIARYRASGLGLARFAREQGVPAGRLHYWLYQKERTKSRKPFTRVGPAAVFQEVKVASALPGVSVWAAEVSLPQGVAVRFSGTAAPGWIGCVVQALQRPC